MAKKTKTKKLKTFSCKGTNGKGTAMVEIKASNEAVARHLAATELLTIESIECLS